MSERSLLDCWSLKLEELEFIDGFDPDSRVRDSFQCGFLGIHGRIPPNADDLRPECREYLGQKLDLKVPEPGQSPFTISLRIVAVLRPAGVSVFSAARLGIILPREHRWSRTAAVRLRPWRNRLYHLNSHGVSPDKPSN